MSKEVLTNIQQEFLKAIGENSFLAEKFYLTGGTALAGFYLQHRYSKDLDFFSEGEIELLELNVALRGIKKKLDISNIDYQQSYNRNLFFFHIQDEVMKTEFTYFPFPRIEKGEKHDGVTVDSLVDIATNKLFTIYQRSTARDYIDLYCILQKHDWAMKELIMKARGKFDWQIDPLQLGTQFLKAEDVKDYPRMIEAIPPEKWKNFFAQEAKKLKEEVIE